MIGQGARIGGRSGFLQGNQGAAGQGLGDHAGAASDLGIVGCGGRILLGAAP